MKHIFVLFQFISIALLSYFGNVLAFDWYVMLQLLGVALGIWAVRSLGENNWSVYPTPNEGSSISATGAYKYVRHPMYTALILFFLPVALRADGWFSWILYGVLVFTLFVKILFEERQLIKKHAE
ncbi:MAG: protein-S-isoprenylcysteine O-methyltransferase Ste14 [Bacteroidia bacterium]|jgi:protein-S-isoprenylcysteine O-methyltransferase Ste14